jgi:hypothetical protein
MAGPRGHSHIKQRARPAMDGHRRTIPAPEPWQDLLFVSSLTVMRLEVFFPGRNKQELLKLAAKPRVGR